MLTLAYSIRWLVCLLISRNGFLKYQNISESQHNINFNHSLATSNIWVLLTSDSIRCVGSLRGHFLVQISFCRRVFYHRDIRLRKKVKILNTNTFITMQFKCWLHGSKQKWSKLTFHQQPVIYLQYHCQY